MTINKDANRKTHIQILRGFAIIAVVLIHNTPQGLSQVYIRPFLNFAVGLFLFLSGLLSDVKKWNPQKRIAKVIIPYIIWTFIYTAGKNISNPVAIPTTFFKNLITSQSAAMMYYIFVYCEFTLLIPLVDKLAKSKYKYLGFIISPIEIIFMRSIPLMTDWYRMNEYIDIIKSVSCLGWFTYFYLGYLMGNDLIAVSKSRKKWGALFVISLLLQVAEGYLRYSKGIASCGSQLKLSSILTGTCFVIFAYQFINSGKSYNNHMLKFLGDISFGIYFSHIAVMEILSAVPLYSQIVIYPLNAVVVIIVNVFLIFVGKKLLGKYSKYLAL